MRVRSNPEPSPAELSSVRHVGATQATRPSEGQARAASRGEKVTVSAAARQLVEQESASAAKVARLRESLQSGSFRVDADAIAAKLVGDDS